MSKIYCFITFFTWLSFPLNSNCQFETDSTFYDESVKNLKTAYFSTIKERALLYNGIEYNYFGRGAAGIPFFMIDTMHPGAVFYDGFLYDNVPLRYDMVNDVLLVKYFGDNNSIQLIKDKISYFSILGHQFVRSNEIDLDKKEASFYELVHSDSKVMVLAKRFKKLIFSSSPDVKPAFVQYNNYFIYKDEKYFSVKSEKDLARIFNGKTVEIRKLLGKKLKYKKNAEQAMVTAALFYNRSK